MKLKSSLYPITQSIESKTLLRFAGSQYSPSDKLLVWSSSFVFVGGVFLVPTFLLVILKRFQSIPKHERKRRALYATVVFSVIGAFCVGPHRHPKFGKFLQFQKWGLWKSWLRFVAFEVIQDKANPSINVQQDQVVHAVSPHGIFPIALALTAIGEESMKAFGKFRAVVASATEMLPFVRDILSWLNAVDASRSAVDSALANGSRLGIAPGGIAEMFEGFPKALRHPNEENILVKRGIMRMAIKHGVPIVPVYCFGSTKLLKRLQLPNWIEDVSLMLRTSLVLFFGQYGLPVPFRQRLLYVMGEPITPPPPLSASLLDTTAIDEHAGIMQQQFCDEMVRLFDLYKASYGWENKHLVPLTG